MTQQSQPMTDYAQHNAEIVRLTARCEALEKALRDVMNAELDPYEVARNALYPIGLARSPSMTK